jgi:uncharacterized repeat protein (TIGR01451 family)
MDDQILDNKTRQEIPMMNRPEPGWKNFFRNKPIIISAAVAIVLIGVIVWYFVFRGGGAVAPASNNVVLLIKGPDQIVSGNEPEYHVTYHNGENANLVNVSLEMFYPSGFAFKSAKPVATSSSGQAFSLPVLRSGGDYDVTIRGKLTGSTGEDKLIKAVLHYRLSNFNSEFVATQSIHTGILPPNLTMDINGPVDVVAGQDSTFTIALTNVSAQDFDNLAIQMTYPVGFTFTSANPPGKTSNFWLLPHLASNSSASIEITGSFNGDNSEEKLIKADLGQMINNVFAPQMTSTATFKIIPSSLGISLTSNAQNGIVKLGDTISYNLKYSNQGNIGLNNLVITVALDGSALDLARLSAPNAIVSGSSLVWKAATLPNLTVLAPNDKGEINFSVPVKQALTTNIKNQTVNASAQISADEASKPTKAADVNLKLGSSLGLTVGGSYVSGAAPMQVGKTTIFAMTLTLSDLSNDLSNTAVTASLPLPPQAWKNVIVPDAEKNRLSYDPNSGKIIWNIGDLAAFTGKFIPALKVTFQLQVTPTEVNRGKDMPLLSSITATGTDTFTNQTIQSAKVDSLTTSTINDSVLNSKGTTVQ